MHPADNSGISTRVEFGIGFPCSAAQSFINDSMNLPEGVNADLCWSPLSDDNVKSAGRIVDVASVFGNGRSDGVSPKRPTVTVLPNFCTSKFGSPSGFVLEMPADANLPIDILRDEMCTCLAGVELGAGVVVSNLDLRGGEEIIRSMLASEAAGPAGLDCISTTEAKDARSWMPSVGRRGFVGLYERNRRPDEGIGNAVAALFVCADGIQAADRVKENLLDGLYGKSPTAGEFVLSEDYFNLRALAKRNVSRLLPVAAKAYGLQIDMCADLMSHGDHDPPFNTVDIAVSALIPRMVAEHPTYFNEADIMYRRGNAVIYCSNSIKTENAVGGTVSIPSDGGLIFVLDFRTLPNTADGRSCRGRAEHGWPFRNENRQAGGKDALEFAESLRYFAGSDRAALTEYRAVSLVKAEDIETVTPNSSQAGTP